MRFDLADQQEESPRVEFFLHKIDARKIDQQFDRDSRFGITTGIDVQLEDKKHYNASVNLR